MTDREHERREATDVPGYERVGGIDDPVPRNKYGDDPETAREHTDEEVAARERREELLDLPNELRGEVRSYYGGDIEATGFIRRVRSIATELERHAEAIEARDEEPDTEGGESR